MNCTIDGQDYLNYKRFGLLKLTRRPRPSRKIKAKLTALSSKVIAGWIREQGHMIPSPIPTALEAIITSYFTPPGSYFRVRRVRGWKAYERASSESNWDPPTSWDYHDY